MDEVIVILAIGVSAILFMLGGFYLANQRDSVRTACTQEMTAKHPERSTEDILKLCGVKQ